jgi:gliding motility-associated-like protein
MMLKQLFILKIFVLSCLFCSGQLFVNNGALILLKPGAVVRMNGNSVNNGNAFLAIETNGANDAEMIISGDFENNAAVELHGVLKVSGNWTNNNSFLSTTGSVFLDGNNQVISGSEPTEFYNLTLQGNGTKTQFVNISVKNILNLTDRELNTNEYYVSVQNTDSASVQRTSGFVSSTGDGFISRNTAYAAEYLFPTGSSIGITRYRPVTVKPLQSDPAVFTVRLANTDATNDGYNRINISGEIQFTNQHFYHKINRTAGTVTADMKIYYDAVFDGNFKGIARWETDNTWHPLSESIHITDFPLSFVLAPNRNDFSQTPYILYSETNTNDENYHIFIPNIFSPNGDGENDVLYVRGYGVAAISFTIYNRWGEVVFESTNIDNGWNGTYLGQVCDPEVFVYVVKYSFVNSGESIKTGTVQLVY